MTTTRTHENAADQYSQHAILIREVMLSDGSLVYNVHVGSAMFPAVSCNDAADMAQKFRDAINDHSTDEGNVVWQEASASAF
jgi:hypothetical protein